MPLVARVRLFRHLPAGDTLDLPEVPHACGLAIAEHLEILLVDGGGAVGEVVNRSGGAVGEGDRDEHVLAAIAVRTVGRRDGIDARRLRAAEMLKNVDEMT